MTENMCKRIKGGHWTHSCWVEPNDRTAIDISTPTSLSWIGRCKNSPNRLLEKHVFAEECSNIWNYDYVEFLHGNFYNPLLYGWANRVESSLTIQTLEHSQGLWKQMWSLAALGPCVEGTVDFVQVYSDIAGEMDSLVDFQWAAWNWNLRSQWNDVLDFSL